MRDDSRESEQYTIKRVAMHLGVTVNTIRALEKRGRLPEGCEPDTDLATGTRYWTGEQVRRLKEWNDERKPRVEVEDAGEEPEEI